MNTTRSARPTGAPAYYLGRSAATWQAAFPGRKPQTRSREVPAIRDATLAYYVRSGARWN